MLPIWVFTLVPPQLNPHPSKLGAKYFGHTPSAEQTRGRTRVAATADGTVTCPAQHHLRRFYNVFVGRVAHALYYNKKAIDGHYDMLGRPSY